VGGDKLTDVKVIAVSRRARHDYSIEDTFEAGLVLTGGEIKSVRAGRVDLRDAFARPEGHELWLEGMHIAPYEPASYDNPDPKRKRKLLLRRGEINRLVGKAQEKGLTLIPLRVHLRNGYAKVELGLARGRRQYDKRRAIAARDMERDKERELSDRARGLLTPGERTNRRERRHTKTE
jgi:SsrA-binding protein